MLKTKVAGNTLKNPDVKIVSDGYSYILESKFVAMLKTKNKCKVTIHKQQKEIADLKKKIKELEKVIVTD